MEVGEAGGASNVKVKVETSYSPDVKVDTYKAEVKVDTYKAKVKVEINQPGEEAPGSVTAEESPESSDDGAASPQSSAATANSGRSTRQRRRCSDPSDNRPSPMTDQQPKRARKGKRRCGCGRDACGEEGPEGLRVCSACNQRPSEMADGPRWKHFESDEAVADAASVWARLSSAPLPSNTADANDQSPPPPFKTDVREGFIPSRDNCLCDRGTCFFAQVAERRLQEKCRNERCCAVCASRHALQWRHPDSLLKQFDRYFTSPHATCTALHLSGGRLNAESWLCNRCYADGYREAEREFREGNSTVEGYLDFLELHRSAPNKDTLEFTENAVLLYVLRRLKGGEPVYFPDALEAMRSAREESGLRSISEVPLRQKVLGMFRDLSRCLVDANQFSFNGDAVGDGDKRRKAHYLMPSKFNPRYVASLHRRFCRLEAMEKDKRRSSAEGGGGVCADAEQASARTVVVDANHVSSDGEAVGDGDKRQKADYLIPSQFSPRYVANLHRRVGRLEKEGRRSAEGGGAGADAGQAPAGTREQEEGREISGEAPLT